MRAAVTSLALLACACAAPHNGETDHDVGENTREDDDSRDDDATDEDGPEPSRADAGSRSGATRSKDAGHTGSEQDGTDGAIAHGVDASRDAGKTSTDEARDASDANADTEAPAPEDGDGGVAPGDEADESPCAGGRSLLASDATGSARVSGYAMVQFKPPISNQIIGLKTTLRVPPKPTSSSTLYVWPGLEPWPGGKNFNPVGQGVLQPVLTWGSSCGSYAPQFPTGWWISPQYVNPYTSDSSIYGCMGGKYIDVQAGEELDITMSLQGDVWSQRIVDRQSGQMTSFDMDLSGQAQNWALFKIELPEQNRPVSDVVFTSTTLTFANPDPTACQPSERGANDYFSAPQASMDGTKCCISRIILRAQGVPATTQNGP